MSRKSDEDASMPERIALASNSSTWGSESLIFSSPDDVVYQARVERLAREVNIVLLCQLFWHVHHLEGAQVISLWFKLHSAQSRQFCI